ncbi:MAG TPA: 4-hydroxy-tetrahydrodipicolinate synthase [Spirochaetia bacterium]|nr:MAG: 4-hydroxy-tetrahydrodipicolinate synthase [Spirochaetes bacterium GWB1_36_13]HCL57859.1 4-hydroxy-tetrahydrodipicolinate synthase [Spirochaetia bacterium]
MFSGSLVAIVTPFKNGKVDYESFEKIIEFQIKNGTNGIIPCGTTGESATLSHAEHQEVIRFTVETVKKRVPVIAGTGSNSTEEALTLTQSAKKMGVDAALLISPYYNKPTQKGIFEHYKYLNDNVDIPMILYNVPGRTSSNMNSATTVALSNLKNIAGIKEASGNLVQVSEILRDADKNFVVLSGDDALTFPMMAMGVQGVISVSANVVPDRMAALTEAALKGDFLKAQKLHLELLELNNTLFIETNPIPVKETLAMMGLITPEVRLPLCPMEDRHREILKSVLQKYQII